MITTRAYSIRLPIELADALEKVYASRVLRAHRNLELLPSKTSVVVEAVEALIEKERR